MRPKTTMSRGGRPRTDPIQRFWPKVNKDGPLPANRPELGVCWLWLGNCHREYEYGRFWMDGRNVPAHKFAWEMENGSMPAGMFACHHCDNPRCVRPSHIFPGTPRDNTRDMLSKARDARGQRNARAVLTDADVVAIRQLQDAGYGRRRIGRMLRRSTHAVGHVLRGTSWKHLS